MVNPNPSQVVIQVTNISSGQSAGAGGTVITAPGQLIVVSGSVNGVNASLPCDCCPTNQCVEVIVSTGSATGTSIGEVGLNPDGRYSTGTYSVPSGVSSFQIYTIYLPTGLESGSVNIAVAAPAQRYNCVATRCIQDVNGAYASLSACRSSCPPRFGYDCVNGQCVSAVNGTYTTLSACQSACISPPPPPSQRFSCVNGLCGSDPNGPYSSLTACESACTVGGYACVNGTCVVNQGGPFSTQAACQAACGQSLGTVVSIMVTDETSGQVASGGGTLNVSAGDIITISGSINPAPGSCIGCVNVEVVNAPVNGSIGTVGLGALGPGNYLYGPATVPSGVSSFGLLVTYTPNGTNSAVVTLNVVSQTPTTYNCVSGQCVQAVNGRYSTIAVCQSACVTPPPPSGNYGCVNNVCVQQSNGPYTDPNCLNQCGTTGGCSCPNCCSGYVCQNGACVPTTAGGCPTGQTFIPAYNKCVSNTTLFIAGLLGIAGLYLATRKKNGGNGKSSKQT